MAEFPNGSGSGVRHILNQFDGSLGRLRTDYISIYWLHIRDRTTPVLEILETMSSLTGVDKVRYWGISSAPAWIATRLIAFVEALRLPQDDRPAI
jgi:aryl-alcohol dehydrogenase-like predicted oxidoreductase